PNTSEIGGRAGEGRQGKSPGEFVGDERAAYGMGFESVASGPLVRSSYHADEQVPVRRAGARV
ncbi:hypothetical protein LCGC14_2739040, partial [marine sediment metagenome]